MKIIFLDIDGVLNGYNFFTDFGWRIACFFNIKNFLPSRANSVCQTRSLPVCSLII